MKIFTAKQIYEADAFTIEKQQITSDQLMERAATQIFNWLHQRMQGAPVKIHLFCGIGNNGGDGIALARHLAEHGYNMEVNVVNYSEKRSKDFLINLDRLKDRKIWPNFMSKETPFPEIGPDDIIVDAIFGIGLNRPPATWVADLMQYLNATGAFILSIDVPSGLYADKMVEKKEAVIQANYVLSFQAPKLVFFLPETGSYIRQWEVLDIGLDPEYLMTSETQFQLIGKNQMVSLYRSREKFSHKGTFGHALVIGGSLGKIGAVQLASRASLTSGCGLVTAFVPKCGLLPLQTSLPEAMVLTDVDEKHITKIHIPFEPTVTVVGPGMGTSPKTSAAFAAFLDTQKKPIVIDADGLNLLAKKKALLKKLPAQSVLTPHPGELERLLGKWKDDFDKLEKAIAFTKKYQCVLVLKGAHTITIHEEKGYVNSTGNPGMATAGSGDVLAGMIAGLMAQGYEPFAASVFAVYLHGRAGDLVSERLGFSAMTATDIISTISQAYLDLFKLPEPPPASEEEQQERE